ncbi:ArnT family glycosyltransferase [Leptospira brenneri]|uniref:Phospholipid carrier-dependent glycosyltransferase n=1 Tax=Leptospira brenneri TaxID=2023182 RepID=A0A2M9Y035_9LEPT|nr:glycosyltransferase family 39 protein [Leptospira brenneri]PJZ44763.1 phospholipid carrier-dependent glycosyltransferase [Leptospira brenneri]TGK97007.1 phospholipid carrier-dependent glycosyltransferase [Leptospira brenneri]
MKFLSVHRTFLILAGILLIFLFYGNSSPLVDQDEAAYAGFSRTMMETRDYLSMEFPYSTPHRKPPLHFWITSSFFQIFGASEWVLRLFPALCILGTSLLTYHLTNVIYGSRTALYAFSILSFSLYFPLNGKIALVDSLLVFFGMLGYVSLYHWIQSNKTRFVLLFWLSVSFGLLVKGPPILIFLGGTCVLLLSISRIRSQIWKLNPFFWLPLSLLPLLVWGYLSWQKDEGELIRWMLDWYVYRRATNPVFGQSGPPGTYLLLFVITLFPWTRIYLSFLHENAWKLFALLKTNGFSMIQHFLPWNWKEMDYTFTAKRFLLIGLGFSWIFYECLASKLPSYPLSAYPILSILLADQLARKHNQIYMYRIYLTVALVMVTIISLVLLPKFSELRMDTKKAAAVVQTIVPEGETLYSLGAHGIPSFAYYYHRKIQEVSTTELPKTKGYFLVSESDFLIWKGLGMEWESLGEPISIYAYDRNKKLNLRLVKTNSP